MSSAWLPWARYRLGGGWPRLAALALAATFLFVSLFISIRSIVVVIRPAEAGVLYQPFRGTVPDQLYTEGIHFVLPWNRMYVYSMRVRTTTHEFVGSTRNGVPIHLKLAIVYHAERRMLGRLHRDIGPHYAHTLITPQVESVMRQLIGRHDPEDIYTNSEGILTAIVRRALEEAGKTYLSIDEVIVRGVELPEGIRAAIDEKRAERQRVRGYESRLIAATEHADRKRIEARRIHEYQTAATKALNRGRRPSKPPD